MFEQVITRKRFCELVGIHSNTLKRWESMGVVDPRLVHVARVPTRVFSDKDVAFGRRLIGLLRSRSGEISIADAAEQVRHGPRK